MKYVVIVPLAGFRYYRVDAENEAVAINMVADGEGQITEDFRLDHDVSTWAVAPVCILDDLI